MLRLASTFAAIACSACTASTTCPGVQYEGKASDEAYLSMVDAQDRALPDPRHAPAMQFADGSVFARAVAPKLTWSSTLSGARERLPAPTRRELPRPPFWRGLIIAEAWAHLPPVTGAIYWLKLATPGVPCSIEALTTNTEWTVSADVWALISHGTGPTSVTGYSAYLLENRITEGPYVTPEPTTFTLER